MEKIPLKRRAAAVDANQADIVQALRDIGASVTLLHAVGAGCPDLVVGFRGSNFMLEVKDGRKAPSKRQLTDDQLTWHRQWCGQVAVVCCIDDAISIVLER